MPKEIFWFDIRIKVKQIMKKVLEYSLNKELEAILEAERYQRIQTRKGYRNGYYSRALITHLCGTINNLLIPRSRKRVKFKLLDKYKRRLDEFDYAILNCFLNGQFTRKIAKFFYNFFSESNITHQTVSNILKKTITDDYLFLIVDASI